MIIDKYKDHLLHATKKDDPWDGTLLYYYEITKPDGSTVAVDVHPLVMMRKYLFQCYVDLGCPDRTDLKTTEPLTATDVELAFHEKFRRKKEKD